MPVLISSPSFVEAIEPILQRTFSVRRMAEGQWSAVCPVAGVSRVAVSLQGEWLTFSAVVADSPVDPWSVLEGQAKLSAGWRYCRMKDESVILRAELAIDPDADPTPEVQAICDGLRATFDSSFLQSVSEVDPPDLLSLCAEAAWSGSSRQSGAVAVPLDSQDGLQAVLEQTEQQVRVRLSLLKARELSEDSQSAIARLLCETAERVRLIRPIVQATEERVEILLEVDLGPCPSAAKLDAALSALQLAGRLAGRESRALTDESVARAYLQVRGWSPPQVDPG